MTVRVVKVWRGKRYNFGVADRLQMSSYKRKIGKWVNRWQGTINIDSLRLIITVQSNRLSCYQLQEETILSFNDQLIYTILMLIAFHFMTRISIEAAKLLSNPLLSKLDLARDCLVNPYCKCTNKQTWRRVNRKLQTNARVIIVHRGSLREMQIHRKS